MNELVTVYIPTKNRIDLLHRALKSVAMQSYKNIEVIVCDDGSDIDISEVIQVYKNKINILKLIRNEISIGASASRNRMINAATGKYITGLDDDDEFLPNRIESFLKFGKLDVYSYLTAPYITYDGVRKYKSSGRAGPIRLADLLSKNIVGNQIFTLTQRLQGMGGFDPEFPAWQDYDTWIRFTIKYGAGYKINAATYKYNIDHEVGRISNSSKALDGYLMFIRKYEHLLSKKNKQSLYFQDITNRMGKPNWKDFMGNLNFSTFPLALKYVAKKIILRR